jgi:hypothetical protein
MMGLIGILVFVLGLVPVFGDVTLMDPTTNNGSFEVDVPPSPPGYIQNTTLTGWWASNNYLDSTTTASQGVNCLQVLSNTWGGADVISEVIGAVQPGYYYTLRADAWQNELWGYMATFRLVATDPSGTSTVDLVTVNAPLNKDPFVWSEFSGISKLADSTAYAGWTLKVSMHSQTEVGVSWIYLDNIRVTANSIRPTNPQTDVPAIAAIKVDGDISEWAASTTWSKPYVYWSGTGLSSTTRAKFAYNDATDMLYIAIQTNEASVQPGGHAVVGFSKNIAGVPTSGIGSTQLAFDLADGNTVTVMNEIQFYKNEKQSIDPDNPNQFNSWGGGATDDVVAAYSFNRTDGTYTYEIAVPLWEDWRIGELKVKQSLTAGDVIYLYSIMESDLETGNGTDMTFNGGNVNPQFHNGAFIKAAALILLSPRPGDANGDGMVDVGDLGILAANYGTSSKTWAQGDFNGDGLVDVGDLGILAAHYGEGISASLDFTADYAKAFGTTVDDNADAEETASSICSGLGLPLITGLALMGLMLVKLEE